MLSINEMYLVYKSKFKNIFYYFGFKGKSYKIFLHGLGGNWMALCDQGAKPADKWFKVGSESYLFNLRFLGCTQKLKIFFLHFLNKICCISAKLFTTILTPLTLLYLRFVF